MYLNRLYSNRSDIFPDIVFNRGLNVILAQVKHADDPNRDSHNLGKTLLIDILEFLLVKGIDEDFFLRKHANRFHGFEFYLDIGLCDGKFLTVKRTVEQTSRLSFKKHDNKDQVFSELPDSDWDHSDIPFKRSLELMNSYLELTDIKPWSFRKGVTYLLRKQKDYLDEFQISKYVSGKHGDWKPYIAKVLGLDDKLLQNRYRLDDQLKMLEERKGNMQKGLLHREEEYDKLKGKVELKRHDLKEKSNDLDKFDFHQRELDLNTHLVEDIEARLSEMNIEIYDIKYDLAKVLSSIQSRLQFDLKEIKKVFKEVQIHFPDQLARSYDDLVSFNKRISKERNIHLRTRSIELEQKLETLSEEHARLSRERQQLLLVLKDHDTLKKFKGLQKSLDLDRADLTLLESQLEKLRDAIKLNKQISELERKLDEVKTSIKEMVREGSELYENVRVGFREIIRNVLAAEALLSIKINKQGNLEFKTEFVIGRGTEVPTSEDEGTSYKKMLCMAFDLAVLKAHRNSNFFRFVYHDGAFETLDNRKKRELLRVIRNACDSNGIQYILSIIEDDLPRDDNDEKIQFQREEIVRELNDSGDNGRLFRMPKF